MHNLYGEEDLPGRWFGSLQKRGEFGGPDS